MTSLLVIHVIQVAGMSRRLKLKLKEKKNIIILYIITKIISFLLLNEILDN